MERNNCNIIKDLIPLCIDGVASEDSMKCVEEHIQTCEDCRHQMELMKRSIAVPDEKEVRMKEAEGFKKMKKSILMGLVIAVCVTLVLSVGGFTAYAIARNVIQKKNETTIRGTWYKDGEEVISFTSWGIAHINEKFLKEDIGLFEGVAAYYLSDPSCVRFIQEEDYVKPEKRDAFEKYFNIRDDDEDFDISIEFQLKASEEQLTLYLGGEEYMVLDGSAE